MTSFLISSSGGITSQPESSCLQMGLSTCSSQTIGRPFVHSSMILLIICWARMIWCSSDPSESALNTFRNTLGGSSATSQKSSTTSALGGLDRASAGVFTFLAMWMILKS